ncbi:MAG: nucleotidyl transferase AbiEii/AbiGii toxin family protein [Cyclobacteriaceae bacterium]|nr:nucleotidyl transferase AbiEii/AbiGii toxin family protein [Cyclobacteriaceae bacterium]
MLSIDEIKPYYPDSLQVYERFILREYLQYKILEIIYDSPYEHKLSFLGGTCLRIVYNNSRFSEDLDFDNFQLSMEEFETLAGIVKTELERLGYVVQMKNVKKGAYHCYIRFPEILFREGLSGHREEKILIQIDTEPHQYDYKPDQPLLNKFDIFTQINVTPKNILLAQKFYAIINRKRNKGRDFYDLVFLMGLGVKPDYNYLESKLRAGSPEKLRDMVLEKCATLSMREMANDVRPFLFDSKDEKKVLLFPQFIEQVELS